MRSEVSDQPLDEVVDGRLVPGPGVHYKGGTTECHGFLKVRSQLGHLWQQCLSVPTMLRVSLASRDEPLSTGVSQRQNS